MTEWIAAPDAWLARLVFQRLLGVVYLVAFVSVFNQFVVLCGSRGLAPISRRLGTTTFRRAPSVFHLHYSDRSARALAAIGIVLAAAVVVGAVEQLPLPGSMLVWTVLWFSYMSFVNVGQPFFGFVWETLLVEAGFLAIFLGNAEIAPALPAILLVLWLLFRLEVGAGLIKIRNDPAWRNLTALQYHHETQPIPNRLSWRFHHLPRWLHRVEVAGNHVAQLIVPFALFLPQPAASVAGGVIILTQLWLMLSGNFAWLNLLTITLATLALDGSVLSRVLPVDPPSTIGDPPTWFAVTVLVLTAVMVVLSVRPVRNMASRDQVMNASYNPLHLGNSYGLFGRITRERYEIVLEGTADRHPDANTRWEPYEFEAKPGDVGRHPRQVAPYHLRLDWMMWFAALSPAYEGTWFANLVIDLLSGRRATRRLLRHDPFPERPPACVRSLRYRYRFTTPEERARTGAWWEREVVGVHLPPVALRSSDTARGADDDPTTLLVRADRS